MSGRLRQSLRARGAQAEAAVEDVRDVEVSLTAQVAGAYLALRGAQERLAVARRNAENQRRTLEITAASARGGARHAARHRACEVAAQRDARGDPDARGDDRRRAAAPPGAHRPLAAGRAGDSAVRDVRWCCRMLPRSVAVEQVVRDRPDVRSAERQLDASTAFVGAARAEYLPTLSLGRRGRLHRQRGARARATRERRGT